ncbi:MAG TPA: YlxR family protein [Actinomycetota bacterium]|nr:YlxR family protein [Actinomycetota bacterium]
MGCRGRAPKRELLRIATAPGGGVAVDPSATAPGRGAYVHRRPECVDAATARGSLARALRIRLAPDDLATLKEAIRKEIDGT